MNYLSVHKLSKSFGERVLFSDISFGIEQGQKVALVGVNGSGKSTLLKILGGLDTGDSGEVVRNNKVKLAYLAQEPELNDDHDILQAVLDSDDPTTTLIREYEYALAAGEDQSERLMDLITQIDEANAWNFENQLKEVLGKLGIHKLDQKVSTLSGGQKKRVGIARALLERPDLVILDEPTNHLDLEAIEWLESYLSTSQMAIIMITHDRYFLESVTDEILEIDQEKIFRYSGSYSEFLAQKAEREQQMASEKEKARNLYKKELEWIRRQPKARGTKAKYRIDAFKETKKKAHVNLTKTELELDITNRRQGGKVVEVDKLSKSFEGKKLIDSFSYIFQKGEKVGIVGKNGTGKSTFLNLITGSLEPDSGKVSLGQTTVIGYFKQQEPQFKSGQKVIEVVQEIAEVVTLSSGSTISASAFLTMFNFSPSAQYDYVDKLSGGEKRRLQLLTVLIKNPNFLILDEPTNDLDLITLQTLEEFLSTFKGCVLIVSHDRYFMDRMVDHLFIFEEGEKIKDFTGNYSRYREAAELEKKAPSTEEKPKVKAEKVKEEKRKASFNEKREFEQLEGDLEKWEKEKAELFEKLNSGESDHEKLKVWGTELKALEQKVEEAEMRWLELSELF